MLLTNSLRILCFGDSITHGWTEHGQVYHPYALALASTLKTAFPSLRVTVDEHGQDGDLAASPPGQFLPRIETLYEDVQRDDDPYDWAIILGGTNDIIGHRRAAIDTYIALQKVWSVPLSHGSKVLALTIPECGHCRGFPNIVKQRNLLNPLILSHHAENFHIFDLGAAVPFFAMPEEKRNEIWEDTIHFTAKGYDLIGTMLANRLIELINADAERNRQDELRKRAIEIDKKDIVPSESIPRVKRIVEV